MIKFHKLRVSINKTTISKNLLKTKVKLATATIIFLCHTEIRLIVTTEMKYTQIHSLKDLILISFAQIKHMRKFIHMIRCLMKRLKMLYN